MKESKFMKKPNWHSDCLYHTKRDIVFFDLDHRRRDKFFLKQNNSNLYSFEINAVDIYFVNKFYLLHIYEGLESELDLNTSLKKESIVKMLLEKIKNVLQNH